MNGTAQQNCVARSAGSARRGSRQQRERVLTRRGTLLCPASQLLRIPYWRSSENATKAKFGKGYRTGSLARIEVFGLLHAVLERKAGEGFFCRVAAQSCPLFFGDPECGFYPRFPLRRPQEDILRFLVEALRLHHFILAQGIWS